MKKLLLHITLFLLPVFFSFLALLVLPLDKKRAYHYLTGDCNGRGAWYYRRLYESATPVDIAFIGSSHTINGINDTLIEQQINVPGKPYRHVTNLGYCRLGRDLSYILVREVLKQKNSGTIILEVMGEEHMLGHPVFPYLAEGSDLLIPATVVNRTYLPHLYDALLARIMYMRQNLWNEEYPYTYLQRENSGFGTNVFNADTNQLNDFKQRRYARQTESHTWKRSISRLFPLSYIRKTAAATSQHRARLIFLYIPPYGSPEKIPIEKALYEEYGELWLPPDTIWQNKSNWYDTDHLNLKGANTLSGWLSEQLK